MSFLIIVILATFTVASIFYQIKPIQKHMQKFDKLGILPNYAFFAPKPLEDDYRLLYKVVSDTEPEWIEIPIYANFTLLRVFWNPFKYYNKGLIDTTGFLLTEMNALENKYYIKVSLYYLSMLLFVSKYLESQGKKNLTIRFAIVASNGAEAVQLDRILFASYYQKL